MKEKMKFFIQPYFKVRILWSSLDLNQGPSLYESGALPLSYKTNTVAVKLDIDALSNRFLYSDNQRFVIPFGFEPKTYCLEGSCSIQLSYGTK